MKRVAFICSITSMLILVGLTLFPQGVSAFYAARGRGVSCHAVQVVTQKGGEPLEGVQVTMEDAGLEELQNDPQLKRYVPLFAPTQTNLLGRTFVHTFGSFHDTDGKRTDQVRGKLIAKKAGYKEVEIVLTEFLGESLEFKPHMLHDITVAMDRL